MLSKEAYKLLKSFNRNTSLTDEYLKNINDNAVDLLLSKGFIEKTFFGYPDGRHASYSDYHITELGKGYVESHHRELLHWRIPVIISVIALFLSAASILISLLQ